MAIEVFPTANDIGGAGTGRSSTEESIAQVLGIGIGQATVLAGMEPTDGGGLTVSIAAGRCSIGGYLVRAPSSQDVTVSDETTGYLWLQLTGADTYAVTATAWVETANLDSPPANAALITKFVTTGGGISSVEERERREGSGTISGTYTGDGGADGHQEIDLGLTPRVVIARNLQQMTTTFRWSISNIFPGNILWPDFDEARQGIPYLCTHLYLDTQQFDDRISSGPGLGIIPDGFEAYNQYNSGVGMNDLGKEYVYLAWF